MKTLNRRDYLALSLGAAVGACATAPQAQREAVSVPLSLDALAQKKGLRFGSAIGAPHLNDPHYLDIVRAECGVLVSENEHKWYRLHNRPDAYSFEGADALVNFAAENDKLYRGHTLLWHHTRWMPRWVNEYDFGANPRAEAERLVTEHINTLGARYGAVYSWDVINETIVPETGEMRDTVYTKHIGPEIIDLAFHAAREAAPGAELVYNDYMTWGPSGAAHRDGVLKHLEKWLGRGVPINALGVQSHLGARGYSDESPTFWTSYEADWRKFMDEVAGMGLNILITEFDVHDRELPADITKRDRIVADYAGAYLDLMLSYSQTKTVMAWGMVDSSSWFNTRSPRDDGLPKRPTPYDAEYKAKPLRDAIAAAFAAAPDRS